MDCGCNDIVAVEVDIGAALGGKEGFPSDSVALGDVGDLKDR